MEELKIIGGGLAGTEAAWQAAQQGAKVSLFEMRPYKTTGAHTGPFLAELVCSNSLGSNLPDRASGILKAELRQLKSFVLNCAEETAIPAGGALAVDREAFARLVTEKIENHPNIRVIREEAQEIPSETTIIASGPLTSPALSQAIRELTGSDHLYFYDAIAPIVQGETINFEKAFRGSRYEYDQIDSGDYINCPMNQEEYDHFIDSLLGAERIELKEFEKDIENGVKAGSGQFFEGCLPIEILAKRGRNSLAFGPMKPVGLVDPRIGKRPYAALQLRQDNLAGSLYNLVGFQTNLKFAEQIRVFRLIPGLENADFERFGQMHRNTFILSPAHLLPSLQFRNRTNLFFAGQITGVEWYIGNVATGLLAGWNAARVLAGKEPLELPETTMLGALCHYVTHAKVIDFQPMKANFGILPPLEGPAPKGKRQRGEYYARRSLVDLENFLNGISQEI